MTGAIFQLKAKGKQDQFLTGAPEQNFLRQSYRQYVNFSKDQIHIYPKENVDFNKKWSIELPRTGDFVNKVYLYVKLPPLTPTSGLFCGWTNSVGHALLNSVSIQIGDFVIDKRYGLFMEIWEELSSRHPSENLLIGKYAHNSSLKYTAVSESEYFIPLDFWFCESLGASLPLFALKYNPVIIHFDFNSFDKCIIYDGITPPETVNILETKVIADYIFIDEAEKEKMAHNEFTFLITQVQSVLNENIRLGGGHSIELPFNHPCSELIWVFREEESENNNDWFNFAQRNGVINSRINPFLKEAKLVLDGTERNQMSSGSVLNSLNIQKYHTSETDKFIYCMPFCADPEKWFPTGTLNFSRVSHANLQLTLFANVLPLNAFVFAKNFNIIKIKDGQTYIGFSV
jgi:hypothetical protein